MLKEIEECYKEINAIYNQKIKNNADLVEKDRLKVIKKVKTYNILAIICAILIFVPFSTMVIPAFFMLLFAIIAQISKYKFVSSIKKLLYPAIIRSIGPSLKYIPGKIKFLPKILEQISINNMNLSTLQELINMFLLSSKFKDINIDEICAGLKVFPSHYNISPDDVIVGTYNDRKVNIIEYDLFQNTHVYSGTSSSMHHSQSNLSRVGQGIIFQTTLDKPFKSEILVKLKEMNLKKLSNMKSVNLESTEFNNIYQVFGIDQVETRYLLTTSMIERLINIHKLGHNISMYVNNNKVTIILKTNKDMFEPDLEKPVNDVNSYYEVISQIKMILDFITSLKLDLNVGL